MSERECAKRVLFLFVYFLFIIYTRCRTGKFFLFCVFQLWLKKALFARRNKDRQPFPEIRMDVAGWIFLFFLQFHEMRDALSNQDSYPTFSWKIAYSALNQLKSLVWAVPSRWRVMENRQFPSHLSGFTGAVSFWRNSISFGIGRKFWSLLCRLTLATGFELSNTE